jgi:hypothetical protein
MQCNRFFNVKHSCTSNIRFGNELRALHGWRVVGKQGVPRPAIGPVKSASV